MNILLDDLPEYIDVKGKKYFIDTDFRTCIIFEKLLNQSNDQDSVETWLDLFYPEERPSDIQAAVDGILYIYCCGKTDMAKTPPRKNGNVVLRPKMLYDFEIDAPYIFGAYLSQYGIDLNAIEYLHWWKFRSLFRSLNSSNKIVEIMSYRATDLSQIKNKSEQARIAKLQKLYEIPHAMTREEKIAHAGAAFGGGLF